MAEQRAFSLEAVGLSRRERERERRGQESPGERERERERLYVVGIDCCSVNGHHVNPGFELQ